MKTFKWSILSIILLSCTCSQDKMISSDSDSLKPGLFSMEQMKGLTKKQASVDSDLFDTIRSSRSYFFLLKNVGDIPITDIKLTVKNKGYNVSPNYISELEPENILTRETDVVSIIRIDIIHGFVINGTGWGGLLAKGENVCTLSVYGTTKTGNGNDTTISLIKTMNIFAHIASLKAFSGSVELNLTEDHACIMTGGFWGPCFSNDTLALFNDGSVPLDIKLTYYDTVCSDTILLPGEIMKVIEHVDYKHYLATIWPSNTISDIYTLPQQFDGKIQKFFKREFENGL